MWMVCDHLHVGFNFGNSIILHRNVFVHETFLYMCMPFFTHGSCPDTRKTADTEICFHICYALNKRPIIKVM